jgi:PAS domain S-box-containing protein
MELLRCAESKCDVLARSESCCIAPGSVEHLIRRVLTAIQGAAEVRTLLQEAVAAIKAFMGCQAVGIRLLDDDGNIPYQAYDGFSEAFYAKESPLSLKTDNCMCIEVVKGTTDPAMPFFTDGGSFWMNGTSRFLATVSEQDKGQTRNECNRVGYESVALVPIRDDRHILGLIHVADTHEGRVPLAKVRGLEHVAHDLGNAIRRIRAEQALRDNESRLSMALNVCNAGIWEWYLERDEVHLDDRFHAMLGYTPGELPHTLQGWLACHHPEDVPVWMAKAEAYLRGDSPIYESEHRIRNKAGTWSWVFTRGKLVNPTTTGAPKRFMGIAMDITQRKQAEAAREALALTVAQKNREIESLVYTASHDLRTPLLNVQGFSRRIDTLCMELQAKLAAVEPANAREVLLSLTREEMPKALHYIQAGVEKMGCLIDGLLRLSRLGRGAASVERLDMDRVLRDVVAVQAFAFESARAAVTIGPLPPCVGDPITINQVFSNLLDNALKYRDPARPLRVSVSGGIEGERAVYCVADNGVGLAREEHERIWEIFHRVQPRGAVPGEGLGLSLVRRIVECHGGETWVESTPDEGSRFYVALPCQPTSEGGQP